ncbi:adenosylcobinamide-GDP ribazoletransferase [Fulvimarina sp. 2208YS6-2-32]|uniref:Adenosylcobinamide-GDP ribazoletransferase n=1 Tax=Fulvimarina uroteuthidis TaxID=3098149 RepID=A0ABU5HXC5_9HYPH|nr:adenosylcobinamide-GDP ribazoletransferase [Fulvimarina sp. 2208YS6-2-32]MDY8107790.1 adenosylcobinamide-GDP ribazoletransferase [Fulvimarina sp. 2208YS6-2-32]
MMTPLKSTLRSLAFLTRFPPVDGAFRGGDHPLGEDVPAFPLAGLVAALPSAILLLTLPELGISALLAAVLSVALSVWVTGALHEDGLGDVADGLFGHLPPERALTVMKDSRVGSYGALALILSVVARIALLAELVTHSPVAAALALLGAAAYSRGLMALLWASLPSADIGGLADRVGRPTRRAGWISAALGGLIFAASAAIGFGWGAMLLGLAFALLKFLGFRRWLKRRLGGQTGDTLGAVQQLTEMAALFGLCLA